MANPKLSVIPSKNELGTSINALIALLKGNKKLTPAVPTGSQNKLMGIVKNGRQIQTTK